MDGIGAKWHYIMETNMEYHGWKQSQMALYNGNGHGIPIKDGNGANWHYIMETDMEFYGWKWSQMALLAMQRGKLIYII